MEYSHDDAGLLKQPAGYWTWAAGHAVVTRIRTVLSEKFGMSQPQWWILNQVISRPEGKRREDVTTLLRGYLNVGDGIGAEVDGAVRHGWITEDAQGQLRITAEGERLHSEVSRVQDWLWAERHEGISDEEYLTTLKVLQRMIYNVGGTAWHH